MPNRHVDWQFTEKSALRHIRIFTGHSVNMGLKGSPKGRSHSVVSVSSFGGFFLPEA